MFGQKGQIRKAVLHIYLGYLQAYNQGGVTSNITTPAGLSYDYNGRWNIAWANSFLLGIAEVNGTTDRIFSNFSSTTTGFNIRTINQGGANVTDTCFWIAFGK